MEVKDLEGKIINADCMDILKQLPDKCIDLVLTDPPYGIGIDGQKASLSNNPKHNRKEHARKNWDISIPSKEMFEEISRIGEKIIIWGGSILMNFWNKATRDG